MGNSALYQYADLQANDSSRPRFIIEYVFSVDLHFVPFDDCGFARNMPVVSLVQLDQSLAPQKPSEKARMSGSIDFDIYFPNDKHARDAHFSHWMNRLQFSFESDLVQISWSKAQHRNIPSDMRQDLALSVDFWSGLSLFELLQMYFHISFKIVSIPDFQQYEFCGVCLDIHRVKNGHRNNLFPWIKEFGQNWPAKNPFENLFFQRDDADYLLVEEIYHDQSSNNNICKFSFNIWNDHRVGMIKDISDKPIQKSRHFLHTSKLLLIRRSVSQLKHINSVVRELKSWHDRCSYQLQSGIIKQSTRQ